MWQPRKDVSLIVKDGVRKCQCCFEERCPGVTTIFQTVQRCALSLVRNVNSIVDVEAWIMGGVVLHRHTVVNTKMRHIY
jgi:hypothetical protein